MEVVGAGVFWLDVKASCDRNTKKATKHIQIHTTMIAKHNYAVNGKCQCGRRGDLETITMTADL